AFQNRKSRAGSSWMVFSRGHGDHVSQADQCFDSIFCVLKNILGRYPGAWLAEDNNAGAAEFEDGLFIAPRERAVDGMNLLYPAHRHCSDLNERHPTEMARIKDTD